MVNKSVHRHKIHYSVGFVALPSMLFDERNRQEVLIELSRPSGLNVIVQLWNSMAGDPASRVQGTDFQIETRNFDQGYWAMTIKFPQVTESHEAQMVGILCSTNPSQSNPPQIRYFTFESSMMPGSPMMTMVGEWLNGSGRRSLGSSAESDSLAMFRLLATMAPGTNVIPESKKQRPTIGPKTVQKTTVPAVRDQHIDDDLVLFRLSGGVISYRAKEANFRSYSRPRCCVVYLSEGASLYHGDWGGDRPLVQGLESRHPRHMPLLSTTEFEESGPLVELSNSDMANMLLRQNHGANIPSRMSTLFWFRRRATDSFLKSSSPVFFVLDGKVGAAFSRFQIAAREHAHQGIRFLQLGRWTVDNVTQFKGNAGMGSVVHNEEIEISEQFSDLWQISLSPTRFRAGNAGEFYFFPNFLISVQGADHQFHFYRALQCTVEPAQLTMLHPPAGANIVGWTYTYVNKNGGPDRRYSHNPAVAIVDVAQLHVDHDGKRLFSCTFSSVALANRMSGALNELASLCAGMK